LDNRPSFPEIAGLAELIHLHVACHEEEAVSLASLHNLKELNLINAAPLQELVISSAAEMTKLSVDCCLVRSGHIIHQQVIFLPHKSDR